MRLEGPSFSNLNDSSHMPLQLPTAPNSPSVAYAVNSILPRHHGGAGT